MKTGKIRLLNLYSTCLPTIIIKLIIIDVINVTNQRVTY